MTLGQRVDRFFSKLEWRWSLLVQIGAAVGSFAVPAWAAKATSLFVDYAPFSWVAAGFCGLIIAAISCVAFSWSYARWVRSSYDRRMIKRTSYVDPMAKTYEDTRIFLNDYCLPSHSLIEGRTFINCEIVGPANIVMQFGNNVQEARYPISDAVRMRQKGKLFNAIIVRNCVFRGCSFQRVTFLVPNDEFETAKYWGGFNWITEEDPIQVAPTDESDLSLSNSSTVEEKQR